MDQNRYDSTFEQYLSRIILTKTQADKIDRALEDLSSLFLGIYDGDVEIYVQGSFATGTTVKPLTANQTGGNAGEFDVDIVLERDAWTDPVSALDNIKSVIESDDEFADKLSSTEKDSCIRIEFPVDPNTGVGFHVDLVPMKIANDQRSVAVRTGNLWQPSDSKLLVEAMLELLGANPFLYAQVLTIKRMRDLAGLTNVIPSIMVLSLLKSAYKDTGSYSGDLIGVLEYIDLLMSVDLTHIRITNPVSNEDLTKKWKADPRLFQIAQDFFTHVTNSIKDGFENADCELLRSVLSDDFPSQLLPENVESLRSEGITFSTNGDLKKSKILSRSSGRLLRPNYWLFFERNKNIRFEIQNVDNYQRILWQVCNAPGSEKLRGDLFEARALGKEPGSSSDPRVNEENELYLGKHWIRCFVLDGNNRVVTIGYQVYVDVKSNGQPSYNRPTRR